MLRFLLKRIGFALISIWAVLTITFFIAYLAPGDPIEQMMGQHSDPAVLARARHEAGLDKPPLVRYGLYVWGVLHGDLGKSYYTQEPITAFLARSLPNTFLLATAAIVLALLVGIIIGLLAAVKPNTALDRLLMLTVLVGVSVPNFVLGPILILIFALKLGWLPVAGWGAPEYVILPAIVLGARPAALIARMTRSSMLETLKQDYIRTARAKGLSPVTVLVKHALKNAFLPVPDHGGSFVRVSAGRVICRRNDLHRAGCRVREYRLAVETRLFADSGHDAGDRRRVRNDQPADRSAVRGAGPARQGFGGNGMSVALEQEREELFELGTPTPSAGREVWRSLWRNPLSAVSMVVLTLIVLMAVFYPMVSPYRYDLQTNDILQHSTPKHWLGTDDLGYDTLTRLAVGARISLFVGVGVEAIVLVVGGLVGLTAGYYGGKRDDILMRVTDIMFAFPDILLAILIMAIRGASLANIFVALGVTGWPGLARLIRGQALSLRGREFVEAARAIGVPNRQIILKHILPNLLTPIIVASTIDIAGVIIAESTLSFLGIGVQPPMPSWGSLISNARESGYWQGYPQLVIYPALCLSLTVLSLNFLGDALRDALDPRNR